MRLLKLFFQQELALILILLLILPPVYAFAQTPEANLNKYWNYRQALKTDFMVANNPMAQGQYIPSGNRNEINGYMHWGDGTWWMGHYLCVVATEYRLLKDNNQDLSETETELAHLLSSLERLDLAAEPAMEDIQKLNGFFLRDDVPAGFHTHFLGISSIISSYQNSPPGVISQDQVWSQLVGLALVTKLVDDSVLVQQARDITTRIVNAMHYVNAQGDSIWEIINPVTGAVVQPNSDVGYLCYGFGEAASWITGVNNHFGLSDSEVKKTTFQSAQNIILFFENFKPYNIFGIEALSTVGNINFTSYGSLYDWLVHVYDETQFHLHFPLVHQILHGFDGTSMLDESVLINLLNSAPAGGPYYYDESNHSPPPWDKINLIANPWQDPANFPGRYNGLDYMLLYNLWFLIYNNDPVPYRKITPVFPLTQQWHEFPAGSGSHTSPITIEAARIIEADNTILDNGNVTLKAGERIILKQGFHAIHGSFFEAVRDTTLQRDIYYEK